MIAPGVYGSNVECRHNGSDSARIQKALNRTGSAGIVTISGTCTIGRATLFPIAPVTIKGTATINYTGSGYALQYSGDNLTVTGLTFNGGGIEGTAQHSQGGWTITHNTFQNIYGPGLSYAALYIDNILTLGNGGKPNVISNNTFTNIWQGGYPNAPLGNPGSAPDNNPLHCTSQECIGGSGIWWEGGLDNTTIDSNTFDTIGYNAIKGFFDLLYSNTPGWAFTAHNIVISNNVMSNVHRIGIEAQGIGRGACAGGCNYAYNPSDGTIVSGNYWHDPAFQWDIMAFSILFGGTNAQYINNTGLNNAVKPCGVGAGIGIESGMLGGVARGNVIASVATACAGPGGGFGFASYIVDTYNQAGFINRYENNTICGPGEPHRIDVNPLPEKGQVIDRYNYKASVCPADTKLAASNIVPVFTSADNQSCPVVGNGTWSVAVVSNLSIRNVEFFVDDSLSPVMTQVLQDVNANFANDRKWFYHATINASVLGGGNHTITSKAMDVSGAARTVSQKCKK
jgi:hypothetical protein